MSKRKLTNKEITTKLNEIDSVLHGLSGNDQILNDRVIQIDQIAFQINSLLNLYFIYQDKMKKEHFNLEDFNKFVNEELSKNKEKVEPSKKTNKKGA